MDTLNLQIVLPALTFVAVMALGGAVLLNRHFRHHPFRVRLRAAESGGSIDIGPLPDDDELPFQGFLKSIGNVIALSGPSRELRLAVARAGFYGRNAPYVFLGAKALAFTSALVAMIALIPLLPASIPLYARLLIVLLPPTFAMVAPNILLSARRARRSREVRRHLPDAVDLMEISVSAGMGLDMAWRSVAEQMRRVSTVMADEMALTDLEVNLGGGRARAMRHMAERTGADELQWLSSAFVQSDRFGTSLSDTLRAFAAAMREDRLRRAEESAEQMAVRILFPLVVFIFPTIIIVCAGPAGIKIAEALGNP